MYDGTSAQNLEAIFYDMLGLQFQTKIPYHHSFVKWFYVHPHDLT